MCTTQVHLMLTFSIYLKHLTLYFIAYIVNVTVTLVRCSSRCALMQFNSLQDRQLSALQHPLGSETSYKARLPSFHALCCDISEGLTLATFHHYIGTATKPVTTFPMSALSPARGPPQIRSNFWAAMTCTCTALMACNFTLLMTSTSCHLSSWRKKYWNRWDFTS